MEPYASPGFYSDQEQLEITLPDEAFVPEEDEEGAVLTEEEEEDGDEYDEEEELEEDEHVSPPKSSQSLSFRVDDL